MTQNWTIAAQGVPWDQSFPVSVVYRTPIAEGNLLKAAVSLPSLVQAAVLEVADSGIAVPAGDGAINPLKVGVAPFPASGNMRLGTSFTAVAEGGLQAIATGVGALQIGESAYPDVSLSGTIAEVFGGAGDEEHIVLRSSGATLNGRAFVVSDVAAATLAGQTLAAQVTLLTVPAGRSAIVLDVLPVVESSTGALLTTPKLDVGLAGASDWCAATDLLLAAAAAGNYRSLAACAMVGAATPGSVVYTAGQVVTAKVQTAATFAAGGTLVLRCRTIAVIF